MMKLILPALALVALVSCNKEQVSDLQTVSDTPIITAGIAGSDVATRASGAEWTQNDAIGIYMFKSGASIIAEQVKNYKYTANATGSDVSFSPTDKSIYFPTDGSSVDFFAYYPYGTPDVDGELNFDLTNQSSLPDLDLLTANVSDKSKNNASASFQFTHRLSLLDLIIKSGTGLDANALVGLKTRITQQRTAVTFDPEFNALGATDSYSSITLNTAANGTTAQAIIMPTNIATDADAPSDRMLEFELETGEIFRWDIPAAKEFNAGEKNIYTITINRTGVSVTSSITDWAAGNGDSGESGSAE